MVASIFSLLPAATADPSRTGKQGRTAHPKDDPTTTHAPPPAPVYVHHQPPQASNPDYASPAQNLYANSNPNVMAHQAYHQPMGDAFSINDADARNRGAQAANFAASAASQHQKAGAKSQKVDQDDLAKLVAEEKENKGKLPKYPGLERWQLIEKMGDGAFSNVYRARDLQGQAGEVAIKVVRKFELNLNQVSNRQNSVMFHFILVQSLVAFTNVCAVIRAMLIFIRTSRSNRKLSRSALTSLLEHAALTSAEEVDAAVISLLETTADLLFREQIS
jgi:hypothetical protein